MKNILYHIVILFIAASCSKDDKVEVFPPDISNIRSEALPGQIVLRWDMPVDAENIHYIEVKYFDHRIQKNVVNLSSCDSLLIDNTRQKYGDYNFKLTPVSANVTVGNTIEYTGVSGPAPTTISVIGDEEIVFASEDVMANSVMIRNGEIINGPMNMFDKDETTIYHSEWQGSPSILDAYIDFNMGEEISAFKLNWYPRTTHAEGKVVDLDLLGSTDGENWFLIRNLTKEKDGLPDTKTDWYRSPVIFSPQPFSYLRYKVNRTNKDNQFWHMSEMEIYKVLLEVIDPESPDYEELY